METGTGDWETGSHRFPPKPEPVDRRATHGLSGSKRNRFLSVPAVPEPLRARTRFRRFGNRLPPAQRLFNERLAKVTNATVAAVTAQAAKIPNTPITQSIPAKRATPTMIGSPMNQPSIGMAMLNANPPAIAIDPEAPIATQATRSVPNTVPLSG